MIISIVLIFVCGFVLVNYFDGRVPYLRYVEEVDSFVPINNEPNTIPAKLPTGTKEICEPRNPSFLAHIDTMNPWGDEEEATTNIVITNSEDEWITVTLLVGLNVGMNETSNRQLKTTEKSTNLNPHGQKTITVQWGIHKDSYYWMGAEILSAVGQPIEECRLVPVIE